MKRPGADPRKHSPALMIAALFLSFAFWAYAQSARSNTERVTNKGIDVRGLAGDLVLYPNNLPAIDIELLGAHEDLRRIDTVNITPFIDLSNLNAGTHRVRVQLDRRSIPIGVEFELRRPYVDVTIERKVSAKRKVIVETTGDAPLGAEVMRVEADPKVIEITGAKSEVDRVVSARATLDLAQAVPGDTTLPVELVDADGQIVDPSEHLRPDRSEVRVKVVLEPPKTPPATRQP